jgi:hypothetical protein
VFRDWCLDQGLIVGLVRQQNKYNQFDRATGGVSKKSTYRHYIKLTLS